MAISTKTFSALVGDAVTAIQGAAQQLLDFTVGSILLAVTQAAAGMGLFLQAMALQIASLTRFSSSVGPDADSWGADFNFPRLPAKAAQGPATFSRLTATGVASLAVGDFVQTQDGSEQYEVIPDPTQPTYNATLAAYVIADGVASLSATLQSTSASSSGNVQAGFINTFASSIVGFDSVSNPAAFDNGADAESDPAYQKRFQDYIAGLDSGTPAAVASAIEDLQQNVVFSITENQNFDGTTNLGYFYVVVDDGSGNPSPDFIASVSNAVDSVRAIGSRFGVFAPTPVAANITYSLEVAAGYNLSALDTSSAQALFVYINALTIGQDLPYTRISQIVYDSSPGITNVENILLNGGTADLTASAQQVCRAGSIVGS